MSLDLLKERFGGTKSTNKKEKDKQKLNEMFISKPAGDIKSFKAEYKDELAEKDRVIENLKQELNSQWLTNKTAFNTKKLYEDKIKKMDIVDSTNLIPTLIEVSKQKQGDVKLDWMSWLEIPESNYLFQINESLAKKVFQENNILIDKNRYALRGRKGRGGVAPSVENYFLSFTGNDEHNQSGRSDTARADLVATQFTPNDPTNKGFAEDSGRKPLAESGFTVSYWWRPDENFSDSFPIGWKRDNDGRFEFGISTHTKPYFSIGGSELKSKTWESMFDDSGNSDLKNTLLDNGVGTAPGSGNKLILSKWYHIVATYAGTDNVDGDGNYLRKIYINGYHIYGGFGEAKQSVNWNQFTAAQMTQGCSFGMRAVVASGNHTDGLRNTKYNNGNACGLDEVAFYNEAKDATWVSSVYNGRTDYNHLSSGGDGLVAYWKFNEGDGSTVRDLGPYGWHGTLTNAGFGTKIDGDPDNSSTIEGINARFPNATPSFNEIKGYE